MLVKVLIWISENVHSIFSTFSIRYNKALEALRKLKEEQVGQAYITRSPLGFTIGRNIFTLSFTPSPLPNPQVRHQTLRRLRLGPGVSRILTAWSILFGTLSVEDWKIINLVSHPSPKLSFWSSSQPLPLLVFVWYPVYIRQSAHWDK